MPTAPYVQTPSDGALHTHVAPASITWDMGAIAHYSSRVLIGTLPGYSDVFPGNEIVNNGRHVTDNTVTTSPGNQQYTKIQYRQTKGGIWRNGGTITSFTCN
jgi:hypothetical protein